MAMPRYRYAIGQAPVRFPSLESNDDATMTKQNDSIDATTSQAKKATLEKQKSTNEFPIEWKRSMQIAAKLQGSRAKAKSMYDEAEGHLKADVASHNMQQSRRSNRSLVDSSHSQMSTVDSKLRDRYNEYSPLIDNSKSMMQKSTRPASTSISRSSRPSSLFWTESEARTESAMVPPVHSQLSNQSTTYGSTNDSSKQSKDDPYGYRALAGPSLLPSYHEQQTKQHLEDEMRKRSCGATITVWKGWKGIFFLLAGCIVAGLGAPYLLS